MVSAVVPPPRVADIERGVVIAQANLLIHQLDMYLELIGQWTEEEDDAGDR